MFAFRSECPRPVVVAIDESHRDRVCAYRPRARIMLSRLRRIASRHCRISGAPADPTEFVEVMVGQTTRSCTPPRTTRPNLPVLEALDWAHHRSLDASCHQAREEAGPLDTVGEVVGVEGDDAAYSIAEVHDAVSDSVAPMDSPASVTPEVDPPRPGRPRLAAPARRNWRPERCRTSPYRGSRCADREQVAIRGTTSWKWSS